MFTTFRHGRRFIIASVAVAVVSALAGCASGPTATPSQTSTSLLGAPLRISTQAPTNAPSTRTDALAAANRTIVADQNAFFEIFAGTISGRSMASFETGETLKNTNAFINAVGDESGADGVTGQTDSWVPDDAKSTVSALNTGGKSYPYGQAVVVGCVTDRWQIHYTSNASTPSGLTPPTLPYSMTVQFQPSKNVWLISIAKALIGSASASLCPKT